MAPLVETSSPCPRCGGGRLLVTVYATTAYEQEIEVQADGRVVALCEDTKAHEEPDDVRYECLRCHHRWWDGEEDGK